MSRGVPADIREQLLEARAARQVFEEDAKKLQGWALRRRLDEVGRYEWYAYCDARRAGVSHRQIARLLGEHPDVLWERHGRAYPPPSTNHL
jgi:hypothetical protein